MSGVAEALGERLDRLADVESGVLGERTSFAEESLDVFARCDRLENAAETLAGEHALDWIQQTLCKPPFL